MRFGKKKWKVRKLMKNLLQSNIEFLLNRTGWKEKGIAEMIFKKNTGEFVASNLPNFFFWRIIKVKRELLLFFQAVLHTVISIQINVIVVFNKFYHPNIKTFIFFSFFFHFSNCITTEKFIDKTDEIRCRKKKEKRNINCTIVESEKKPLSKV